MADGLAVEIPTVIQTQLGKWESQLRNPVGLVKQLGVIIAKESIKAFRAQELGDIKWPPRYPTMLPPKINLAGALADFKSGRSSPKPHRFQDRPALIDQGARGGLVASLTPDHSVAVVNSLKVRVGTNKEYARLHQEGGESVQSIDTATKDRIDRYLARTTRGPRKRRSVKALAAMRLKPLLNKKELVTTVNPRPFLGVTDRAQAEMGKTIVRYFKQHGGKG
jgi:phage gpG-like protein